MNTLIKLTKTNGEYVWVNPNYISTITSCEGRTFVFIANDTSPFYIKESPEEIIMKMSSL